MRYGIFTYGSRGDVQPYIALALGLMQKGHEVLLAAPENFKEFVEGYGVPFHPLYGNVQELLYSPEGLQLLRAGSSISLLRFLFKAAHNIRIPLQESIIEGCKKSDVLVVNHLSALKVAVIAEKLHKKWAIVQLNPPVHATKEFPALDFDLFNFPSFNLLTYRLLGAIHWKINKKDTHEFRQLLGLPILTKSMTDIILENNVLTVHCFSPELIARPKDWGSHLKVTGFLTLPASNRETHEIDKSPEGLKEWLMAGEKPIYVGFGSIPIPDVKLFTQILQEILSNTSYRIVFCIGWSKIPNLPEHPNLFVVKHVSHEWLLPQCRLAIVHGGIGTITASLRAQIPVIVLSIFADQPWWGKIVTKKQLGTHIPFKKLTAGKLLKAISDAQSTSIKGNAFEIGKKIKQEDGVKMTMEVMEEYFA